MYTKRQRTLAFAAFIAFVIITVFSALFIVNETDHDCAGDNCPICAAIKSAENTLKSAGGCSTSASALGFSACVCCLIALICGLSAVFYTTPVTQKVRMDN